MRVLVVGAGIFGCNIGIELSKAKYNVDIVEQNDDIMKFASLKNHNRLHLGYHYLRSIKTAKQSIDGLISFLFYYGQSVLHSFPNYYAIAKEGSYTSGEDFIKFCDEVGIDYDEEYPDPYIMNREKLEVSFKVPEPVFDYGILKSIVLKNIEKREINVMLNVKCQSIKKTNDGKFIACLSGKEKEYDVVVNATYENINSFNSMLAIPPSKLLYEDVIIPSFSYNKEPFGLTVMDGPFCSVMPKGKSENRFLLYHVKESVLRSHLGVEKPDWDISSPIDVGNIYKSSVDYYPFLKDAKKNSYSRGIRAVYENKDDARLTELITYNSIPNYFVILSGKITTCIHVALAIKHHLQGKKEIKSKIL